MEKSVVVCFIRQAQNQEGSYGPSPLFICKSSLKLTVKFWNFYGIFENEIDPWFLMQALFTLQNHHSPKLGWQR
jgi:hypothetical protein